MKCFALAAHVNANLPVPPAAGKVFGFNTNLWWQTSGGQDLVPFEVDRPARAGAQLIRTTVTWATFATSPDRPLGDAGHYYPTRGTVTGAGSLKQLDELYHRASAAGLKLDLVINNAPKWASAWPAAPPRSASTRRAAARLQGRGGNATVPARLLLDRRCLLRPPVGSHLQRHGEELRRQLAARRAHEDLP